jgi:hypothetical protein
MLPYWEYINTTFLLNEHQRCLTKTVLLRTHQHCHTVAFTPAVVPCSTPCGKLQKHQHCLTGGAAGLHPTTLLYYSALYKQAPTWYTGFHGNCTKQLAVIT